LVPTLPFQIQLGDLPKFPSSGLGSIDIALATAQTSARSIDSSLASCSLSQSKSIAMPALMSKRPSAALREIHRELDRCRKFAAVVDTGCLARALATFLATAQATCAALRSVARVPRARRPRPRLCRHWVRDFGPFLRVRGAPTTKALLPWMSSPRGAGYPWSLHRPRHRLPGVDACGTWSPWAG
jgi:hypothetical protein